MKKILFDTNVLLDVLLHRQPHYAASARALDLVGRGVVEGYVAGHAVATISYLLEHELGRDRSRAVLADLMSALRVAAVTDAVVRRALTGRFSDFEDALCHEAAVDVEVSLIITRNVRDFRKGVIRAVLPGAVRREEIEEGA